MNSVIPWEDEVGGSNPSSLSFDLGISSVVRARKPEFNKFIFAQRF